MKKQKTTGIRDVVQGVNGLEPPLLSKKVSSLLSIADV